MQEAFLFAAKGNERRIIVTSVRMPPSLVVSVMKACEKIVPYLH
jgi:hypothetical protein